MTAFYQLDEYLRLRDITAEQAAAGEPISEREELNRIFQAMFVYYADWFSRLQAAYGQIFFASLSVAEAQYFKDVIEYLNLLLLLDDASPGELSSLTAAVSNLYQAFLNIGTYDGFIYAARAFLGINTTVMFNLQEHKKLAITISDYDTPFFDLLITDENAPANNYILYGDTANPPPAPNRLRTQADFFFEGNVELVNVLLQDFVPAGVVYSIQFVTTTKKGR